MKCSITTVLVVLGDNGKGFLYPIFCHTGANCPRAHEPGKMVLSRRPLFRQMLGGLVEGIWEQKLPIFGLLVTVLPTGRPPRKGSGRCQSRRNRDRDQRSLKTDDIANGPTPKQPDVRTSSTEDRLTWLGESLRKANQGHPAL